MNAEFNYVKFKREYTNSQFNTEWFSHANRDDNIKMRYLWFSESFMTDHENV